MNQAQPRGWGGQGRADPGKLLQFLKESGLIGHGLSLWGGREDLRNRKGGRKGQANSPGKSRDMTTAAVCRASALG